MYFKLYLSFGSRVLNLSSYGLSFLRTSAVFTSEKDQI